LRDCHENADGIAADAFSLFPPLHEQLGRLDRSHAAVRSGFVKAMSLTDATMLVAGSMIGSGIFIVLGEHGAGVPSPLWLMLAWVLSAS
jgi:hypothetical protein